MNDFPRYWLRYLPRYWFRYRLLLVPALWLVVSSCDDATGPDTIDKVVIGTVDGDPVSSVAVGDLVQLEAMAYSGASEIHGVDFEWSVEDSAVATVDTIGRLRGVVSGNTTVMAHPVGHPGVHGQASIEVVNVPVAELVVTLPGGFLDLGHTVKMEVTARDSAGELIAEPTLVWSAEAAEVEVDQTGMVTGLSPGMTQVEAESWDGVRATAEFRVTPITGVQPDSGYFGSEVIISGESLPDDARVYFSRPDGEMVEAFIHDRTAGAYEVWVPVGAGDGPIAFVTPQDSFVTSRVFTVPEAIDIFEHLGIASERPFDAIPVLLPFPYQNPSLLLRAGAFYHFVFEIGETTPFTWHLVNRSMGEFGVAAGIMFHLELTPEGFYPMLVSSYMETYDYVDKQHIDSVAYSREELQPGWYALLVGMGSLPGGGPQDPDSVPSHGYGLNLSAAVDFALPPDQYEPNDYPQEAPTVELPFQVADLNLENPWALDYYVIELQDSANLIVSVESERGNPDLAILAGDTVDYYLAPGGAVVAEEFDFARIVSTEAVVPPGIYTIMVQEYGGQATPYSLEITTASPGQQAPLPSVVPAQQRSGSLLFRDVVTELRTRPPGSLRLDPAVPFFSRLR